MRNKRGQLLGLHAERWGETPARLHVRTCLSHTRSRGTCTPPPPQLQADGRRLASKQESLLIPKGARSVSFGAAGREVGVLAQFSAPLSNSKTGYSSRTSILGKPESGGRKGMRKGSRGQGSRRWCLLRNLPRKQ